MSKVFIPSVSKKALVVVLLFDASGGTSSTQATRVFNGIKGMLENSDLDVAVIKVPIAQGVVHESASFVFVRSSRGEWGRIDDKALLQSIIRAGL